MRKRDLFSAAAGAVAAFALAGGIAWAAIPAAGGAINGCYQKNQGQLRVIDPGTDDCRPSEVGIVWNQQGVKGDRGEKGEAGAPGKDGRDGRDGLDGTSAAVEPEAPGANCAAGGVKITAANGAAYVCNALPPDPGKD
ncbi:MAG: hypothetical protein WAQ33_16445 [Gaiellaceae bacterium]